MGLRSRLSVVLGVVTTLVVLAPVASAITIEPPGKAGANQYAETIPTSGGNTTPPSSGSTPPPHGGALATLGHGGTGDARLARLGGDGRAAATLAAATAPTGSATPAQSGASSNATSNAASNSILAPHGDSPLSTIAGALSGSDNGGIGALLPLLLAATLLAVVLLRVWTRRQGANTPEPGA